MFHSFSIRRLSLSLSSHVGNDNVCRTNGATAQLFVRRRRRSDLRRDGVEKDERDLSFCVARGARSAEHDFLRISSVFSWLRADPVL